jgi:hypothetical protein
VPVAVIAAWIGHKDASLTMRLYAPSQADALSSWGDFGPGCVHPRVTDGCFEHLRTVFALLRAEPMTGIEPAYSAWEADVLPLNYIGAPGKPGLRRLASRAAPADAF